MKEKINELNLHAGQAHKEALDFIGNRLSKENIDVEKVITDLASFQVAIPSWALGTGGTRFGRFSGGGEPTSLEEKLLDVNTINQLTGTADSVSLHIPWDIPEDPRAVQQFASDLGLKFDAVNSNTFQDQKGQQLSYKFGSLGNAQEEIRRQAILHNKEVIRIGDELGSKSLTVWLSDGSSFPGQMNFRNSLDHTYRALEEIYSSLPSDWSMLIEYKPYEPHFYHTIIQDWGTSFMLASELGDQAFTLVDLGHHLPNTNIENIVSTLHYKGKLGGFHFNDSKYGDDDLTVGSIKPYQLFLIFNELVMCEKDSRSNNPPLAWMIDASHNLKDPLEDLIQSLDAILIARAQALLVNHEELKDAQQAHDVVRCQEILQNSYRTDVRSLVAESRRRVGAAIDPIGAFRSIGVRASLIKSRGQNATATGL